MTDKHCIEGSHLITKRHGKTRLRQSIFEEWGAECAYCKNFANTLDHIRPIAKGGLTTKFNLVPACSDCNINKSHKDMLTWFRSHHGWSEEKETRIAAWIGQDDSRSGCH